MMIIGTVRMTVAAMMMWYSPSPPPMPKESRIVFKPSGSVKSAWSRR